MKTITISFFAALSLSSLVSAEDAMARVVFTEQGGQTIWITAASAANLEFKIVKDSLNRKREPRSSVESIYFFEPPAFTEALELFKNRDYKAAQAKFTEVKAAFARVDELPGNYSTLSSFYELECARRAGDLDGLVSLLEEYRSGGLQREDFKQQEEIYVLWDALRSKEWTRIETIAEEMLAQKKWTGSQLTQIFYCQGLAREGLGQPYEALNSLNSALSADFTASHEITPQATLACLRIIGGLEEVALAKTLYGTEDENPSSQGHRLLNEAAALCQLWDSALGAGQPLPEEFKEYLKYKAAP